jgi:glycosyltransferase involved in cell wall biosynthesis
MDVTVVIPTRDRLPLLRRTLASVLRQRCSLEVVVVDEASSDGTAAWLAAHPDARVRTIRHSSPLGVARARNDGIDAARGEWLAFLDDDDLWAPSKLGSQLDALARDPRAEWSVGGAVSVDEQFRLLRFDDAPPSGRIGPEMLKSNCIPGGASGVMARAELVRRVGGFDTGLSTCADWDLWIRLAFAAPIASVHRPLVAYLVHRRAMTVNVARNARETKQISDKYRVERERYGVQVDEAEHALWRARILERAGRRRAAWYYLRHAWLCRAPSASVRAAAALWAPSAMADRRDAEKAGGIPPAWRHEVAQWLPS